jgi:UDP-glucose 4-epimerase
MLMNILVTGGAGFIASQIVDGYIAAGHRVTVVDNLTTGRRKNLHPDARFVEADIRDAEAVRRLFVEGRFDLMNHHAAQIDVRRSVADPVFDASVNVLGVLTLLEACMKTGVGRVIFASTGGAIYGEQDYFPADEQHPTRPISPYGIGKLTTEHYLHYYQFVHGITPVILRYANVYGPRQNPEGEAGVVSIFTTRLLAGQQAVINGDGEQTRDYVYVGDVVRANVIALGVAGVRTFNVGTGVETTVTELFRRLNALTGGRAREEHGPAKKGEQARSVLSSGLLHSVTGWAPSVTIEEGLALTTEYFRHEAGDAATARR